MQQGLERWASDCGVTSFNHRAYHPLIECSACGGPSHWVPKEHRREIYCSGSWMTTLLQCSSRASPAHLGSILSCASLKVLLFKDVIRAQKIHRPWEIFWMWSTCWAGDSLGPPAAGVWGPPNTCLLISQWVETLILSAKPSSLFLL